MKNYIVHDAWKVIEKGFFAQNNKISESLCSIGNGKMGQRANFEEQYTGATLRGSYVAGLYYPDKTRVGWWKNGYPEYFAKVLNATNWIGIDVQVNGEILDLAKWKVIDFYRELDMQKGLLSRSFIAENGKGEQVKVSSRRFLSMRESDAGAIEYSVTALNFDGNLRIEPYLDGDVFNEDANYDEKFWTEISKERSAAKNTGLLLMETKKTQFRLATAMQIDLLKNGQNHNIELKVISRDKYVSNVYQTEIQKGDTVTVFKYVVNAASIHFATETMVEDAKLILDRIHKKGFEILLAEHIEKWKEIWDDADVIIEGDVAAQQGIRFNIFQLYQTYTGEDERLNIGPKGFTGEKYGGVTYWDTEAYCLPFYLKTTDAQVARNLLIYRYKHLQKAIENAEKLGFKNGAALYPMVTINGEECHNEWEITFEEIHRNGAIAHAIFKYINYTGDEYYLAEYGLEVLIAISRFWKQRVNWSEDKQKYVMLGVTGPNEYENNVNNNWYTNTVAKWTLQYTLDGMEKVKSKHPELFKSILKKVKFNQFEDTDEAGAWFDIIDNMYFPVDEVRNVFLQQDGFLDKIIEPVTALPVNERPINQNWSWDRILRSCYIKQADVLQGLYFLENQYDMDTIRRNFDFYEPITVHESSLSPCVHSILAARLGYKEKAYELYLRTSRLDLDDYNNDTEDGCHITSMAGTWMSVVEGFAGLRNEGDTLFLRPFLPDQWEAFSFTIQFRSARLKLSIQHKTITIENISKVNVSLVLFDEKHIIPAGETLKQNIEGSVIAL
ncbi:MAG: glycoside hydrolase family 65 protein [Cyclobacteriaceae bacterium]|nr:glycoside hydrolase family 65 protein [Cyclobacteriaceae bacterium]